MSPFIVTSEVEKRAALERLALLAEFPPGSPEAAEREALLEAVELFEHDEAESRYRTGDLAC